MHLAVIKHDILVIILKQSDQCFILSDEYIVDITYNGPATILLQIVTS